MLSPKDAGADSPPTPRRRGTNALIALIAIVMTLLIAQGVAATVVSAFAPVGCGGG